MQHPQQGISLQQQGPNRSDSPPHHQQHPFVAHAQAEQFAQAQMQSMFGASNAGPEYASYGDGDNQTAFDSGVFRHGGGSFNYFQNRPRQSAVGMNSSFMNDGSGSSFPGYGMTAADVFGTHQSMQSLTQQQQPNDMRGYDLVGGPQKVANKPIFTNLDPFGTNGLNANIIQPHQNSKISPTHQQSHQQQQIYSGQSSYLNGVLHGQAHSQTPFGPHLTTNGVGAGLVHTNGNSGTIGVSTSQQEEISTIFVVGFPDDMQEREFQNMFTFSQGFEAATLKIPNKDSTSYNTSAPSSNLTNAGRNGAYQLGYPYGTGANDPYNLVTVNQGGVIVDGRDGTTSSWPAAPDGDPTGMGLMGSNANNNAQQGNVPPRKQIIGFAKFKTRTDALVARDILQGRRVDIEKGAVLKAEMAKKNLHTKRGVGPLGPLSNANSNVNNNVGGVGMGVSSGMGSLNDVNGGIGPGMIGLSENAGMSGLSMLNSGATGTRGLSMQEREMGAIGAMGLGVHASRRDRERLESQQQQLEEELEVRKRRELGSTSLGAFGNANALGGIFTTRGARERLEEDERERERRRKEKEVERTVRLRAGSAAMFESYQPSASVTMPLRNASIAGTGLLSPTSENNANSFPFSATAQPFTPQEYGGGADVWSNVPGAAGSVSRSKLAGLGINGSLRTPVGVPTSSSNNSSAQPTRPPSSHQSSPSDVNASEVTFTQPLGRESLAISKDTCPSAEGVEPQSLHSQSSISSVGSRSRPYSPANEQQSQIQMQQGQPPTLSLQTQVQQHQQSIQPMSAGVGVGAVAIQSASSAGMSASRSSSSSSSYDGDMARAMGNMEISSQQGTISPQLPSPNSAGASSGTRGTGSDQNPPINTLYVGNLPTSPAPSGYAPNHLEDSLRALFQRCQGFRRLCFRQKANGPMCFVEFEDVPCATKALSDLYGHQLGGLVKGGIRLSYSKNPLGVRTPTNTANAGSFSHQQGSLQTFGGNSFSSMQEAFSHRPSNGILSVDMNALRGGRRDQEVTSPGSSYHFSTSPPRFFSPPPPPSMGGFGLTPHQHQGSSALSRLNTSGGGMAFSPSSFAPFGAATPPGLTPQVGGANGSGGPTMMSDPSGIDVNSGASISAAAAVSSTPNLDSAPRAA